MLAAGFGGHKEMVEMLIEKGADVNTKSNDGKTALALASQWGRKEIAAILLSKQPELVKGMWL